ncbi:SpoIVB peptidase S55 [Orenia metallireducens]|uniref:SpoIVB peptidase S55 n=1 Tax=Orenia metallireducens TaxID=1413210 RepID=A0A1C0A654_9FIRM|nr:SpoIVB peptidase S55 domain-containing protein [Orenia metallireducens]OCL25631.1 SpoIVB peptidase S55 [Orenia metallireducens]
MRITLKIIAILLLCITLSNIAIAKTEIMSLSEVRPGMKGTGKTVLRGNKIEEFDVEVVSVLTDQPGQDLILVKTSGEVIDRTGGIASGMSGSPVYIGGRLIGAVGYGWQLADHKIGMVTPIESMLDIFELDKKREIKDVIDLKEPIKIGDREYKRIYFAEDSQEVDDREAMVATPVSTPLMVSGIKGRAKDRLAESLEGYELVPINGGGVSSLEEDTNLEPGSAVAVQLVRGDINVSAIGTVTYRDGDKILAFGHPFLSKGSVNYLLSSAYIHQMVTSIKMPFKLGSPGKLKGIITQDRTAGIAGKVNEFPNVVPLEVNVFDHDLNKKEVYNLQIVQSEDLIEGLASSAVLQVIDSTIDRTGEGTAKVSIEILGNKLPNNIISLENLYYSPNDIAATSLSDFLQSLSLILHNPFTKVNLANIKFNIDIEKRAKVALIEEIKLDKEQVAPGEEVEAEITLRPYREDLITKKVKIEIPQDIEDGKLEVHVFSGQEANLNRFTPQEEEKSSKANNIKSLDELIEVYQQQNKNNQLVIELRPSYTPPSNIENSEDKAKDEEIKEEKLELAEEVVDTSYVLEGTLMEEIEIITKEEIK